MPRPSIDWITSDWHLYHNRIIEWCNRPTDHVEQIVKRHKELIYPQDTMINLGDLIFYNHKMLKLIMMTIPGKKVLVLGNHDKKTRNWYTRAGFDFVCDSFTIGSILFTHKPVDVLPPDIELNVHGHWHHTDKVHNDAPWWSPETHFKVSLEESGYRPLNLQKIRARSV